MSVFGNSVQLCKFRFLRIAAIGSERSEWQQSAHVCSQH